MDFFRAQFTKIPHLLPVDLSKSTVLITGANAGIGFEAAREILGSRPARLIVAVRDLEKGNAAKRSLAASGSVAATSIEVRELDQASFQSVRSFAKGLEGQRIDIAILNAGSSAPTPVV